MSANKFMSSLISELDWLDSTKYDPYYDHSIYYFGFTVLGLAGLFLIFYLFGKLEIECNEYNNKLIKEKRKEETLNIFKYTIHAYRPSFIIIGLLISTLPLIVSIYNIWGKGEKFTSEFNIQKAQKKQELLKEIKAANIKENYEFLPTNKIPVSNEYENLAVKSSSGQIKNSTITLNGETVDCKKNIPLDTKLMQANRFSIDKMEPAYKNIKTEPFVYLGDGWAMHKTIIGYLPREQFIDFLSSCYNQYNKKIYEKKEEEQTSTRKYYNNLKEWDKNPDAK